MRWICGFIGRQLIHFGICCENLLSGGFMKRRSFLLTTLTFLMATPALAEVQHLECKGTIRKLMKTGKVIENEMTLDQTYTDGNSVKFERDFPEGVYMGATWETSSDDVRISITEAPSYTNGVTTTVPLSNGWASLGQTKMEKTLSVEKDAAGNPVAVSRPTGNYWIYRVFCIGR